MFLRLDLGQMVEDYFKVCITTVKFKLIKKRKTYHNNDKQGLVCLGVKFSLKLISYLALEEA